MGNHRNASRSGRRRRYVRNPDEKQQAQPDLTICLSRRETRAAPCFGSIGANSRRRYDVAYGIRRADDLAAVVAFFEARNGRLHGFRFKDWADFKSCLPSQTPGPTNQPIGTGNGVATVFQLTKRYPSGAQSWTRTITKPVAGTVTIALNGATQASGWSVSTTTGLVTFTASPALGVAITAGFDFDVPVRFDTDALDVTLDLERLGSITSIPLVEIRT